VGKQASCFLFPIHFPKDCSNFAGRKPHRAKMACLPLRRARADWFLLRGTSGKLLEARFCRGNWGGRRFPCEGQSAGFIFISRRASVFSTPHFPVLMLEKSCPAPRLSAPKKSAPGAANGRHGNCFFGRGRFLACTTHRPSREPGGSAGRPTTGARFNFSTAHEKVGRGKTMARAHFLKNRAAFSQNKPD